MIVPLGDSVTIDCTVAGWPPPTSSWFKDGLLVTNTSHMFIMTNGSLHIDAVRHEDTGKYVCVIGNSLGILGSPPLNISIGCKYTLSKTQYFSLSVLVNQVAASAAVMRLCSVAEEIITPTVPRQ